MPGYVGGNPVRIYSGVIVSTAGGYSTVRVADDLDFDGNVCELSARGTAAADSVVTVAITPGGTAYLI